MKDLSDNYMNTPVRYYPWYKLTRLRLLLACSIVLTLVISKTGVAAQSPGVYDLVKDSGADPTGLTDSTPAVQSFFNTVSNGQVGLIPQGTYSITSTISIYQKMGMRVNGLGPATTGQTIFRWDGPTGGVVFALNQVMTSYFEHFSIRSGAGQIGVCMDSDNIPPLLHITSDNRYDDVSCAGSTIAGFRFSHQSTQNDELHFLNDVSVQCDGGKGISIEDGQAKFILVRGGSFSNCDEGIGIIPFGSLHAWNPRFTNNTLDLHLGSPFDTIALYHPISTGAQQLLLVDGETGAPWPVLIENGDFDVTNIPVGTDAILNLGPGPLVLKNNNFHSNAATVNFAIWDVTFGSGGGLLSIGNTFPGGAPFQGNGQLVSIGDIFNGGGVPTPAPIITGPILTVRP